MSVLVKICGIGTLDDARLAGELGAAAVGFVFWPGSPRYIEPELARAIVADLPPFIAPVGVFVDQPPGHIAEVAALVKLAAVQLHGDEAPADYISSAVRVIKAVAVSPDFDAAAACDAVPQRATLLLDAHDPVRRGGTGQTIDWSVAADVARRRPIILSGGLTPSNIAEAIAQVRPYAVDVSSGVELAPGIKDPEKLAALFAAVTRSAIDSRATPREPSTP
jgi:phosphoribosylanthranilate isomerase